MWPDLARTRPSSDRFRPKLSRINFGRLRPTSAICCPGSANFGQILTEFGLDLVKCRTILRHSGRRNDYFLGALGEEELTASRGPRTTDRPTDRQTDSDEDLVSWANLGREERHAMAILLILRDLGKNVAFLKAMPLGSRSEEEVVILLVRYMSSQVLRAPRGVRDLRAVSWAAPGGRLRCVARSTGGRPRAARRREPGGSSEAPLRHGRRIWTKLGIVNGCYIGADFVPFWHRAHSSTAVPASSQWSLSTVLEQYQRVLLKY